MGVHQGSITRKFSSDKILVIDAFCQKQRKGIKKTVFSSVDLLCDYDVVHCLQKASERIKVQELDALIFNQWRPNREGLGFLRYSRKTLSNTAILIIGDSQADDNYEAVAYEYGADNYFIPSCSEKIIVSRLKGLLNRHDDEEHAISISDMKVWTQSGVVFRAGNPIKLSTKEMELLLYLAANKTRPVSRLEILQEVFGLSFEPGTNVVEVHIHRLRHKIDGRSQTPLLNTVRGEGYVLG